MKQVFLISMVENAAHINQFYKSYSDLINVLICVNGNRNFKHSGSHYKIFVICIFYLYKTLF